MSETAFGELVGVPNSELHDWARWVEAYGLPPAQRARYAVRTLEAVCTVVNEIANPLGYMLHIDGTITETGDSGVLTREVQDQIRDAADAVIDELSADAQRDAEHTPAYRFTVSHVSARALDTGVEDAELEVVSADVAADGHGSAYARVTIEAVFPAARVTITGLCDFTSVPEGDVREHVVRIAYSEAMTVAHRVALELS